MGLIKKLSRPPLSIFLIILAIIISLLLNNFAIASVSNIEFIGQTLLPTGLTYQKTEIGGLSGITYDNKNDLYYAISDDRGEKADPRFYTLKIDLSKGNLTKDSVVPMKVTTLLNENNRPFPTRSTDTEGIAYSSKQTLFISSEGDVKRSINPFIKEFSLASGQEITTLPIPDKFLPNQNGTQGIRDNLAFESLTITPNEKYLFTANENALVQDGTVAKTGIGSSCRILQYNLLTKQPEKEFLYQTEPVTSLFNITGRFASGLPDILALDNKGNFLSIERSFTGIGFAIFLFHFSLENADDIHNIKSISAISHKQIKPVKKKLLLDLRTLDVPLDNIEGLTFGPKLPDGKQSLILISDNNFNQLQTTQILAFKVKIQLESPFYRLLRRIRNLPLIR
ncbi:esterase-like activity of phytase family protein [Cronbergia sp. UHCC 0137]|uniref:esterase-like activity of phytase family protein n=1 Tax=Cronbergia sp. UHCC 0137 TaxID=3110239 RepID=UPI002B20FE9C|nr:esterase-like activity of phytase family protein [Cronbergia sp. UHCC 0137]MEA5618057.1 esterase-like activity of phytase family protein [Cronbergia sp. UHCC 0137]